MRLAAIVFLLAAGILAGTQLGKIAPLVGWYRSDAGFSLVMVGWLAALICYPPFILMGDGGPLSYHQNTADWAYWMQGHDLLLWTWAALLVFVLVVGTTVGVSLVLPKQYDATASVVIDIKPDPVAAMAFPTMAMPSFMATQVDIINSERYEWLLLVQRHDLGRRQPIQVGPLGEEEGGARGLVRRRDQHQRRRGQQRQQRQVLGRVERQLGVERSGRGEVAIDHHAQRVIVGGLGHLIGGDVARRTGLVFHHHRLADAPGQAFGQDARGHVGGGPGRKAHQDAHRLAGPSGLRGKLGHASQCGQSQQQPHAAATLQPKR